MTRNLSWVFKQVPKDYPVPGEHIAVEDRPIDLESAPAGGLVLENLYASFDPYLRGKMRDPGTKSYSPPFEPGQVIENAVLARVLLASEGAEGFAVGETVVAFGPVAEYAALPADRLAYVRKIRNPHGLDPALFLGPLGMPGLTAFSGLAEIAAPRAGETIFISSAAGAVGQVAGQICKAQGLRVIGSVGSDAKLDFITRDLGFDAGFNYKKESAAAALPRLAPDGIDIYFDNVGGDQLDAALECINRNGRIPVCGMISGYNQPPEERYAFKNIPQILAKQLKVQGFLQGQPEFGARHTAAHQETVGRWLAEGSFKPTLHVVEGMNKVSEGFVGMLKGENFGKAVLKIR